MAFATVKLHPDAEPGLLEIHARGDAAFAALKERIAKVQNEWEPGVGATGEVPQLVIPFDDYFLVFTVSEADATVLV
ncbi:MAG: hypothetical protein ACE5GX_19255, partial [Thermoanaerobaculia bacterium]